jgi:hypothetical protein
MDKRIRDMWTRALRSGDYFQGIDYLKREEEGKPVYCCLGVLCELYTAETGLIGRARDEELPGAEVMAWADLPLCDPRVLYGGDGVGRHDSLSALNDSGEFSFGAIADLIEEQL